MMGIGRRDQYTAHEVRRRADRELAARAATGDDAARRQVAERLLERVRATVRYLSANDRDRDDWVQESMLEILSSLNGYRGDSSLESWADRITVRTSLRRLKRRRFRETMVALAADPAPSHAIADTPDHAALLVRRRVAEQLRGVEPDCRVPLVLKLVQGYSVDEIATLLELPRDTVKGRLKRGRAKLKQCILKDPVLKDWGAKVMT